MSDELEATVELYPPWKQALVKFLDASFAYSDIVPHSWFFEAFGIEMPGRATPYADAQKAQLLFLSQFKSLQAALLEKHQIDLVNERGLGYALISPREQAKRAYDDGTNEIKKTLRRTIDRAANVNTALLSSDERRNHADMLARIGMLNGMYRRAKALPEADDQFVEE